MQYNRCVDPEQAGQILLCRSILYGALAQALYPPDPDTVTRFSSEDSSISILRAASFLDAIQAETEENCRTSPLEEHRPELARNGEAWASNFSSLDLDSLMSTHGRLFGHTVRGLICPYEAEYGQDGLFQQPQQLATLMGFYNVFGLRVRQAERERPDHISCELEFLQFLSQKESYALDKGNGDMATETQKAGRLFLKEHLGRFGRAVAYQVKEHDSQGFFGGAAGLLFDFLTLECRQRGLEAGPAHLPLSEVTEDRVPMGCSDESNLVELET